MDRITGCNWIQELYVWYHPWIYLMDSVRFVQLDKGISRVASSLEIFD
jgi:hypothetical protein